MRNTIWKRWRENLANSIQCISQFFWPFFCNFQYKTFRLCAKNCAPLFGRDLSENDGFILNLVSDFFISGDNAKTKQIGLSPILGYKGEDTTTYAGSGISPCEPGTFTDPITGNFRPTNDSRQVCFPPGTSAKGASSTTDRPTTSR